MRETDWYLLTVRTTGVIRVSLHLHDNTHSSCVAATIAPLQAICVLRAQVHIQDHPQCAVNQHSPQKSKVLSLPCLLFI